MNKTYQKEISTTRRIRLPRDKANFIRTKGIIDRSVMYNTNPIVDIGQIPYGIANKINMYCNMEVYAESKWNFVQCMDKDMLKKVYTSPIESVVVEANDSNENNNNDAASNVSDNEVESDQTADTSIEYSDKDTDEVVETEVEEVEQTETEEETESIEKVNEDIVDEVTEEETVVEETKKDTEIEKESVEEDTTADATEDDAEEEIITRTQAPVTQEKQITRPTNNYNNKKYQNSHKRR